MKTYQDLLECGESETERINFIKAAITSHKGSKLYREAVISQQYYNGENTTIKEYEKVIYDMAGRAKVDNYSANYKLCSNFFSFAVDQENSYLLSNGVTLQEENKRLLGENFDHQIYEAAKSALIHGVSFGFWNLDHLEVFNVDEFVPLYDENDGALKAGIRFWQIEADKPLHCSLYELDGVTEYSQDKESEMQVVAEKRPYIIHVTETEIEAEEFKQYTGENYPGFPIVPLKNNKDCLSELHGKRSTVDALDLCCSNMVNNVDDNILYWSLVNCGGMSIDEANKFIQMVRSTHVAFVEDNGEGATATPHQIEAPFDGMQATINMLQKKLYQDFQAFDANSLNASNLTATAIRASYIPLDLKVDKFEWQVTSFITGILQLAGIDDKPTYTRNQIVNKQEELQTLLQAAQYVTSDYLTKKILTILGDVDQADDILKAMAADELDRLITPTEQNEDIADGVSG